MLLVRSWPRQTVQMCNRWMQSQACAQHDALPEDDGGSDGSNGPSTYSHNVPTIKPPPSLLRKLSGNKLRTLRHAQLEWQVLVNLSEEVPLDLSELEWLHLLEYGATAERINYLISTGRRHLARDERVEQRRRLEWLVDAELAERQARLDRLDLPHAALEPLMLDDVPGASSKHHLAHLCDAQTQNEAALWRAACLERAGEVRPNIVIDMRWLSVMRPDLVRSTAVAVAYCARRNELRRRPPQLQLVNCEPRSDAWHALAAAQPHIVDRRQRLLIDCTSDDYLARYQREKLVYVTLRAPNELPESVNLSNRVFVLAGYATTERSMLHFNTARPTHRAIQDRVLCGKLPFQDELMSRLNWPLVLSDYVSIVSGYVDRGGDWQGAIDEWWRDRSKFRIRADHVADAAPPDSHGNILNERRSLKRAHTSASKLLRMLPRHYLRGAPQFDAPPSQESGGE